MVKEACSWVIIPVRQLRRTTASISSTIIWLICIGLWCPHSYYLPTKLWLAHCFFNWGNTWINCLVHMGFGKHWQISYFVVKDAPALFALLHQTGRRCSCHRKKRSEICKQVLPMPLVRERRLQTSAATMDWFLLNVPSSTFNDRINRSHHVWRVVVRLYIRYLKYDTDRMNNVVWVNWPVMP